MSVVKALDIPIYNTSVCFVIGGGKEELDILKQDNPDKIDEIVYRKLLEDIQDGNRCDGLTASVADGTYFVFIRQGLEFNPIDKCLRIYTCWGGTIVPTWFINNNFI